ncbi:Pycsar system effector family protein [Kitasatospora humi]|uniref:Pycsar system effector family protein n=1 Tax=Kitasatospora humi TaxID=2893891 RepID=UPI0035582337
MGTARLAGLLSGAPAGTFLPADFALLRRRLTPTCRPPSRGGGRTGTRTINNQRPRCRFWVISVQESGNPRVFNRCDQKSGALLTADAVLVASVGTLGPVHGLGRILVGLGVAALIVGAVLGILVIRPTLAGLNGKPTSFLEWGTCESDEDLHEKLAADQRGERIRRLSQLCRSKMVRLQGSALLSLVALAAIAAAGITAQVG